MNSPINIVFRTFADEYLQHNSATLEQHRAMKSIIACKSGDLGYNVQACEDCGEVQTHYNSCGNRHCPNCQAVNKDKWIFARKNDILPVKYHHTVFTVPAELRTLFKFNKKMLYNLLFKTAWETIDSFSKDKRNRLEAEMGMIAILHTWKQNLEYHPHLHCIIPAGGITKNNKWKSTQSDGDYLFNVEALSSTFKGKFLNYLKQFRKQGKLQFWDLKNQSATEFFYNLKENLYNADWVVYSKKSFESEHSVFEYLGRYTHKIAISNFRIKEVSDKAVSFSYTDRSDNYKTKIRTLYGVKFIKLFIQHVLPSRFMKIRNYGFLSSRNKTAKLAKLFAYFCLGKYVKATNLSTLEFIKQFYEMDVTKCSECGGRLITIELRERPKSRASPKIQHMLETTKTV
ncbi:MAG: IS91 family transposase [Bacteroidetes bacterium]|nr:IS91 family transposase [Bacteroidota bacterium]MBT6686604.1 IS91 family transposase [Bacteroidota bacterium]MBT7143461.1 IS91 family transposase [Bacteroidota bacterium]MBT7491716.1 IS91 family transposase [Bacteroidota bacterium]